MLALLGIQMFNTYTITLYNPYNISPTHQALKSGQEPNALYGNSGYDLSFGYTDMRVNPGKQCSFGFPNTYTDITGRDNQTFTSVQISMIKEIEVYQAQWWENLAFH